MNTLLKIALLKLMVLFSFSCVKTYPSISCFEDVSCTYPKVIYMGKPDTIKLKAESDTGIHKIIVKDGVDTLYYNEYLYNFTSSDPEYIILLPKSYKNHFVYNPGSIGKKILDVTIEAFICDTTFQVEFEVK